MLQFNRVRINLLIMWLLLTTIKNTGFCLQYGNGTDKNSLVPIQIQNVSSIQRVYASTYNTFIIKNDGSVWGTGENINKNGDYGASCAQKGQSINKFVKIMDGVKYFDDKWMIKKDNSLWDIWSMTKVDDNVIKVSNGLYIKTDKTLWAYGSNSTGAFGTGTYSNSFSVPHKLRDDVIDVYYNYFYSMIITKDHQLLVTGESYLPEAKKQSTYVKIAGNVKDVYEGFYVTMNNELYTCGFNYYGVGGIGKVDKDLPPQKVMDGVKYVSSNQTDYTLILKTDGSLYGCGGGSPNYYGGLGLGDRKAYYHPTFIMSNVKTMSAGDSHSAIVKNDGTLWMCGSNDIPALM